MRFPIGMAKFLGRTTAKYRWFAVMYMVVMFVALPSLFMGLSFAGAPYVIAVAALICSIFLFAALVNLLRRKRPTLLPRFLRSWKWLPTWCRSLEPYDKMFSKCASCRIFREKNQPSEPQNTRNGCDLMVRLDTLSSSHVGGNGNLNPAFTE